MKDGQVVNERAMKDEHTGECLCIFSVFILQVYLHMHTHYITFK